jgi:hypothetical protein
MQVAFVHQVATDVGAYACFEQDVIGQHHSGAASRLQTAVDVLQEGQLFIAGGMREIAGRATAAFGCAERRIGQYHIGSGQLRAGQAEGIAQMHHAFVVAFHAVQQAVHQG